jgi:hypothetical protein
MTESDWVNATDPTPMLEFLRGRVSDRKLRLFGAACCRRNWAEMKQGRGRDAVEVVERFADGLAGDDERRLALSIFHDTSDTATDWDWADNAAAHAMAATMGDSCVDAAAWAAEAVPVGAWSYSEARASEQSHQCRLLRDIVGNPFRPVAVEPAWLTPTVTGLARAAYDGRALPSGELDFARLAVLADALEEAGCTDVGLLGHLRGPGPHVRGCWALDTVLGRS